MKCLLDLDGVLVDFVSGWWAAYPEYTRPEPYPSGVWNFAEHYGIPWKTFNDRLDVEFWENLPWMPDGKAILEVLERHFGRENICILSSNSVQDAASAAAGKVLWIERNMPDYKRRYFLGANKHFVAHSGTMLIDDKNENVDEFIKEGGKAFLLPRPWNREYHASQYTVPGLESYLKAL